MNNLLSFQQWKFQKNPIPKVLPQTHFAKMRLDQNYFAKSGNNIISMPLMESQNMFYSTLTIGKDINSTVNNSGYNHFNLTCPPSTKAINKIEILYGLFGAIIGLLIGICNSFILFD